MFTSSNLVCWQGKEKVKPTGSFLSLMLCFSMKSPRHSATWSNSWSGRERLSQGDLTTLCQNLCLCLKKKTTYSRPAAVDDVLWRVVDLTLHLNGLLLLVAHPHVQDPEVTSSQIQCDKVPLFYGQAGKGKNNNFQFLLVILNFLTLDESVVCITENTHCSVLRCYSSGCLPSVTPTEEADSSYYSPLH